MLPLHAQKTDADRKQLAEIRSQAENRDPEAQRKLGDALLTGGLGVTVDEVEAAKWLRKSADQNNAPAQLSLGFCFANGEGVATDKVEAVKWYRKAAEQGLANAQNNLGVCYYEGLGVPKDEAVAVNWFRKAAEQNHAEAQSMLGNCYDKGHGLLPDFVEAAKWYRKAAEQGIADAQFNLGVCYYHGQGVAKDAVEAVKWFRKAAEQNDANAQASVGGCYDDGEGVVQDDVEALKWYRKAAEQGNAGAQSNLGTFHLLGRGTGKDAVEAVKWLRMAAEQNYARAQYNLGVCYDHGDGVAKDEKEALKWWRKASEQGNAGAQFSLGLYYQHGRGIAKDYAQAAKWYRKAAEQNHAHAQLNLGVCYYTGLGVAKDYMQAYKWLLLAAAQGEEQAREQAATMEVRMTPEQVAEGQKLARDFKPRELPSAGDESPTAGSAAAQPVSSGTGFFITDDGYLITNEHVAGNDAEVRLLTAGGLIPAKVVKVDAANDLALLKAEGRFAALPVVSSRSARSGATVATVGFPNIGLQGFAPKLAKGEIASLTGAGDDARYFQISVPVQPGNSGGALVDERGNVVGVVSAKLNARAALAASGSLPENVNYAVKSSFLLSFLESVPEVSAKLKEPSTQPRQFEDVVKSAEQAAVLVLVY